jgi:hypothetical protein
VGRTISSNRRGEERRDLIEIVDPLESCFNPLTDLNETSNERVRMLSPVAESFDGSMDASPPFDVPDPNPLVLGKTRTEMTRVVRNDDAEGFSRRR